MAFCDIISVINSFQFSRSVVSDSLRPHSLQPTSLLRPWNPSGKDTGVGCHSLLQGIFLTLGSNPGLPHCRWLLYHLSHQGSPELHIFPASSLYPDTRQPEPG